MKFLFSLSFSLTVLLGLTQEFQYAKQITGSGLELINDMVVDGSGNTYVIGSFTGTIQLGSQTYTALGTDIWFGKFNSSGTLQWGKAIPNTGIEGDDFGVSIDLDNNNNVYVYATYTRPVNFNPGGGGGTPGGSNGGIAFAKYSSSGSFNFVKFIANDSGSGLGSILISPSQNRIFIGGTFSGSNIDFNPDLGSFLMNSSNGKAFIAKYDLNGTFDFATQFGSNSNVTNLAEDGSGNIYATGTLTGTAPINLNPSGSGTSFDPVNGRKFVAKYNSNFGFIAANQVLNSDSDKKNGIALDNSGNVYISGAKQSLPFYTKYNSSLSQIFEKHLNGASSGAIIDLFVEGNGTTYITGNISGSNISLGNFVVLNPTGTDAFVAKYNNSGTAQSGIVLDSSFPSIGKAIFKSGGDVIVGGDFEGTSDFNACLNTNTLTANSIDAFLVKYDLDDPWYGSPSITGQDLLCNSTNGSFTLNNAPSSASITWTTSSNLSIVSGQGTNAITVVSTNPFVSGNSFVRVRLTGSCPPFFITKSFWLGRPDPVPAISYDLMFDVPDEICVETASATGDFYAGYVPSYADNARWESDAGPLLTSATPTYYSSVSVRLNNHGNNRYIRTRNENACGESAWTTEYFDLIYDINGCDGGGGGIGGFAMVYPNPSSDEVTVKDQSESKETELMIVELRNETQELKHRETCNLKEMKIDLRGLEKGVYYLEIRRNNLRQVERLIIE